MTPAPPRPLSSGQTEVQPVSAALSLESYQEEAPAVAARLDRTLQAIDQVHSDGDLLAVIPTRIRAAASAISETTRRTLARSTRPPRRSL